MAENNLQRKVMRLSIIGDSQTGKSSILNVYLGNDFTYDILSNIGIDKQSVEKQMKDGNKIKIKNSEKYQPLMKKGKVIYQIIMI